YLPPRKPSPQRAKRDGCVHYLRVYVRSLLDCQMDSSLGTRTKKSRGPARPALCPGQFKLSVPSAYSTTCIPRPRAESSLMYRNGSNAISGGMTPLCLIDPFTIHWAAIEVGPPVPMTPPPTFHFF